MRAIGKRPYGDIVILRLHDRIQHDVVLEVPNAARSNRLRLPGRLSEGDYFLRDRSS